MELEFSSQIFENIPNIEFHQNPSKGSRVVPCRRTDVRTEMTKLIVAFCNFANVPNNDLLFGPSILSACDLSFSHK
jgi:hypothetical protein